MTTNPTGNPSGNPTGNPSGNPSRNPTGRRTGLAGAVAVAALLGAAAFGGTAVASGDDDTATTAAGGDDDTATTAAGGDDRPTAVAGTAVLAPVAALELAAEGFAEAAAECEAVEIEVVERNAEGDIATMTAIMENFVGDEVDFIHAVTTPGAQAAYQVVGAAGGTIPVAYSAVTDPFAAGLATDPETHDDWITGSQSLPPFEEVVDAAQAVVPDLEVIGMPFAPSEANSDAIVEAMQAIADERGLTLELASVADSSEVGQAATALVSRDIDVFILPTITTVEAGMAAMVQVAGDNDIPMIGSAATQADGGAALAIGADYHGAGVRAGEIACAVLSGEQTPADFDVINIESVSIAVNEESVEAQGATIPEELLADAEIVG